MVDEIESSVHRDQIALEIFLGIMGAFNNLSIKAGINGMRNKDLLPCIRRWHAHYLANGIH